MLEEVWTFREEQVYPGLFGEERRGIFPLSQDTFAAFETASVDPRWLQHGVFEFAPTPARNSWLHVTSGYSNPWKSDEGPVDPLGLSGAGLEFVLETQERGDWAIRLLQALLAFDMMLSSGQLGSKPGICPHDRIPVPGAFPGGVLDQVIAHEPVHFGRAFDLPSGKVDFLQFVGVTEAEAALARAEGFEAAKPVLEAAGAFPVTRLTR